MQTRLAALAVAIIVLSLTAVALSAEPPLITGAAVPESAADVVIHVDGASPDARDSNDGTADRRLRTIGAAVQKAEANNRKGIGSKILIYPGVYREAVSLQGAKGRTDAPTPVASSIRTNSTRGFTAWRSAASDTRSPNPTRWSPRSTT